VSAFPASATSVPLPLPGVVGGVVAARMVRMTSSVPSAFSWTVSFLFFTFLFFFFTLSQGGKKGRDIRCH